MNQNIKRRIFILSFLCTSILSGCATAPSDHVSEHNINNNSYSYCRIPYKETHGCNEKITVSVPKNVQILKIDQRSFTTGGRLKLDFHKTNGDLVTGYPSMDVPEDENLIRIHIFALQLMPQKALFDGFVKSGLWKEGNGESPIGTKKYIDSKMPSIISYYPLDPAIDGTFLCGIHVCFGLFRDQDVSFKMYFSAKHLQNWNDAYQAAKQVIAKHVRVEKAST